MRCGIATWRTQMIYAWLHCDLDVADHASYGIATINTATKLATWHCGLKDANYACLVRICDLTDGIMIALRQRSQKDANRACDVALRPGGRKWSLFDCIAI